jgi:hypothetical protein
MLKISEQTEYSSEMLFSKNHIKSEKIMEKIRTNKFSEIFEGLGYIKNDGFVMDYKYFKYFATNFTYEIITKYIDSNIMDILKTYNTFNIYINMQSLSITDVDKHREYICFMSKFFSERYPNRLHKCYVYNAPFIFEKVFSMIHSFIDKETQTKINLVK